MQKDVSVVIANYNNAPYLKACLGALYKNEGIKEVVVVDDHSTDDSLNILKEYPAKVIENSPNVGPVKSRNIGTRAISGSKYILFLDGDAEIQQNYISSLVHFLEAHPNAGVVSGKIISEKGERMWYNFGYAPSYIRNFISNRLNNACLLFQSNVIKKIIAAIASPFNLNFIKDSTGKVDWVVEMAFLTRTEIFQKLNGFDENFFMFFEGPDYCARVKQAGYQIYYLPDVSAQHLGGHTHSSQARREYFNKSAHYYFKKHPKLF